MLSNNYHNMFTNAVFFFHIDTQEYLNFFIFILSTFFLGIIVYGVSLLLSWTSIKGTPKFKDKFSPYECGFLPYGDARGRFEVHFYLVALLFIVFDLEIILILPWAINTAYPGFYGLYILLIFFFILGVGILYEWNVGALNWFFIPSNKQYINVHSNKKNN